MNDLWLPDSVTKNSGGLQVLEEEDRKEIIKLQEATHTSVIAFVLSLFIPLVGLILGVKAKSEIDKSEHTKSGSAFAVAAIWIGAIGTLESAGTVADLEIDLITVGSGCINALGDFQINNNRELQIMVKE
eukprot:gene5884-5955_t